MAELILKTADVDTLKEKRIADMQAGKPLVASQRLRQVTFGAPQVEAVGVSHNAELNAGGMFDRSDLINGLSAPQLSGPVRMAGDVDFLDIRMQGFGGRSARQAFADGTLDQLVDDARMRLPRDGAGNVRMDGNGLIDNWQTLIDAARFHLTISKALNPTVREFMYAIIDRPDATAIEKVNELFPYAFEFVENDGTGQAVEMGEMMGGQTDTISQRIFSVGLQYDLQKYLFDRTLDMAKVNEGIAISEAAKKDDIALAPIINYTYASAAKTAADATGSTREEKLWMTLSNALEDIIKRRDPVTSDRLIPANCVMLAHPIDAMHIAQVVPGFDNVSQNVKRREALTQVSRIIGYEGARIQTRSKGLIQYTDLTEKKAYILVPNRRMIISRKRGLQLNIDANPDVLRLSREQMAWWYCEGQYNDGIGYFVQEVTLPAW